MTNQELSELLKQGIFGDRETIQEAYNYLQDMINTLDKADRFPITTAVHVLLNTISNEIEVEDK